MSHILSALQLKKSSIMTSEEIQKNQKRKGKGTKANELILQDLLDMDMLQLKPITFSETFTEKVTVLKVPGGWIFNTLLSGQMSSVFVATPKSLHS